MKTRAAILAAVLLAGLVAAWLLMPPRKPAAEQPPPPQSPPSAEAEANSARLSQTPDSAPRSPAETFSAWLENWQKSPESRRAALLPEGIRLARLRRDWLLGLIQNDPAAALQNALSAQELAALPPEIAALCESRFDASAFYGVLAVCGDTSPEHIHGPACRLEREVRPGGILDPRRLIAHTFGPGLARKTGENTRVTGIVLDDHIAVAPPGEGSP